MTKQLRVVLILLVGALAIPACGGDDASTDISAVLKEFEISPGSYTIPAGEEITIEIENAGSVDHEWVLLQPGVTISSEADLPETEEELLADFVYWEEEVAPGDTQSFTFTAPAAGDYQVVCAIEGHFDAGMEAQLTVVDP
ncbi:MAG TPA: cupredoxin domain-containing protein [Acidimicrobiia bacterium]